MEALAHGRHVIPATLRTAPVWRPLPPPSVLVPGPFPFPGFLSWGATKVPTAVRISQIGKLDSENHAQVTQSAAKWGEGPKLSSGYHTPPHWVPCPAWLEEGEVQVIHRREKAPLNHYCFCNLLTTGMFLPFEIIFINPPHSSHFGKFPLREEMVQKNPFCLELCNIRNLSNDRVFITIFPLF